MHETQEYRIEKDLSPEDSEGHVYPKKYMVAGVAKRVVGGPVDAMHKEHVALASEEIEVPAEFGNARQPADQRLNVRFTPEAYAQLQEMAMRRGLSVSETVRRALSFDLWFEESAWLSGYSLQLRRGDGAVKTVARPKG